jgi:outer membrane cobalamin receptor
VSHELTPAEAPFDFSFGLRGDSYSKFAAAGSPPARVRFGIRLAYAQFDYSLSCTAPGLESRYRRASWLLPNPELEMEKAHDFTLTLVSDIYDSPTVSLKLFFREIADAIIFARGPAATGRYENVERATVKGAEFSFAWRPVEEWRLSASYTYEEARDEQSDRWLPARPRHRGQAAAAVTPREGFTFTFSGEFGSEQFIRPDNADQLPAYFRADLRAEYQHQDLTVFGALENLMNRKYLLAYGEPAPPFTWSAGIKYSW